MQRQADPEQLDMIRIQFTAFVDMVNRKFILPFQINEQDADLALPPDRLMHHQMQHARAVLAAGKTDINLRKRIEDIGNPFPGGLQDILPYETFLSKHRFNSSSVNLIFSPCSETVRKYRKFSSAGVFSFTSYIRPDSTR